MSRWGYTARTAHRRTDVGSPVRHLWHGLPASRPHARIHAACGTALIGLGPQREIFDPWHPRACRRCAEARR